MGENVHSMDRGLWSLGTRVALAAGFQRQTQSHELSGRNPHNPENAETKQMPATHLHTCQPRKGCKHAGGHCPGIWILGDYRVACRFMGSEKCGYK